MAQTEHVEMREDEDWRDVADAFMKYCLAEKNLAAGGCHEGDPIPVSDGRRYAAISIPDHSSFLIDHLHEWAARERRDIKHAKRSA
jgi:hypothetical protein